MTSKFGEQVMERRLDLPALAAEMHADGRISDVDFARVGKSSGARIHPLVFLAEQKLEDAANPGRKLDMADGPDRNGVRSADRLDVPYAVAIATGVCVAAAIVACGGTEWLQLW